MPHFLRLHRDTVPISARFLIGMSDLALRPQQGPRGPSVRSGRRAMHPLGQPNLTDPRGAAPSSINAFPQLAHRTLAGRQLPDLEPASGTILLSRAPGRNALQINLR